MGGHFYSRKTPWDPAPFHWQWLSEGVGRLKTENRKRRDLRSSFMHLFLSAESSLCSVVVVCAFRRRGSAAPSPPPGQSPSRAELRALQRPCTRGLSRTRRRSRLRPTRRARPLRPHCARKRGPCICISIPPCRPSISTVLLGSMYMH